MSDPFIKIFHTPKTILVLFHKKINRSPPQINKSHKKETDVSEFIWTPSITLKNIYKKGLHSSIIQINIGIKNW